LFSLITGLSNSHEGENTFEVFRFFNPFPIQLTSEASLAATKIIMWLFVFIFKTNEYYERENLRVRGCVEVITSGKKLNEKKDLGGGK
jgi:hypothetical protein